MKYYKEFPAFRISLLEEGIVHIEMKDSKEMTLADIIQIYDEIEKIGNGEKMCVLTTFNGFVSSKNNEVIKYAASARAKKLVIATAYVIRSLAMTLAVKFFMGFHKQVLPRRIFQDKKKALEWLRKERANFLRLRNVNLFNT